MLLTRGILLPTQMFNQSMLLCFSCRLHGNSFYVSFLVPVFLIVLLNSIAFVCILHSLMSSGSKIKTDRKVTGFQQLWRGATVFVFLGLTWLFGVCVIGGSNITALQYLFSIFNTLQGFFVFVFYCLLPAGSRKRYKSFVQKKLLTEAGSPNTTNFNTKPDSAGIKRTKTARERNDKKYHSKDALIMSASSESSKIAHYTSDSLDSTMRLISHTRI